MNTWLRECGIGTGKCVSLVWFSFPIPNSTSPHCTWRKAKLGESLGTTLSFSSTKVVSFPDHQIVDHLQSWVGGSLGMRLVQKVAKNKARKNYSYPIPFFCGRLGCGLGIKLFSQSHPHFCVKRGTVSTAGTYPSTNVISFWYAAMASSLSSPLPVPHLS